MTKGWALSDAHIPLSLALAQWLASDISIAFPPAANILTVQQMDKVYLATPPIPISLLPTSIDPVLPS